jgi:uncharacterized protein (TIGR02757 family)
LLNGNFPVIYTSAETIKDLLDQKVLFYNNPSFISADPISVPHRFVRKQDIEIAGFLAATIAWGNRKSIVANATRLVDLMGGSPHEFMLSAKPSDLKPFTGFVHRTFNGDDCLFFISALQRVYREFESLETLFGSLNYQGAAHAIHFFREYFLDNAHLSRSRKHIADPLSGSSAKRINMFLRWMVRRDHCGVDFGLWKTLDPANLVCPLDVHSGRVARALGLLMRKQNDWKSAMELTENLRKLDACDPVRYDFALFGMGVFEGKS